MITVLRLDHFVMTCGDIARTVAFYERVLGMRRISFGAGRTALRFGDQKINLHQAGAEIKPNAPAAAPGTADICLVTDCDIDTVVRHLKTQGVAITLGPIDQEGAVGPMHSVYFRDPDDNLVEIAHYADQPLKTTA